jgi:RecB family exonuclease
LRNELADSSAPAEGVPERRRLRRDRRYADVHLTGIEHIAPAMAELETVAARIRSEATLAEIWRMVAGFGSRWLKWPPDPPGLLGLAGHFLDPLLDHPASSRLTGAIALRFLAERLHAMRLAASAPGRTAVTITTAAGAAGRRFAAVRVLGLAEGIVPRAPREDPILPGSLRRRLAAELDLRLATPEDQVREDRRALDRVVNAGARTLVLTAPRQWLDRSEREVSGALLEIAARAQLAEGEPARVLALPTLAQFRARLIAGAVEPPTQAALAQAVLPGARRSVPAASAGSAGRAAGFGRAGLAIGPVAAGGRLGALLAPEVIPGLTAARPISATAILRLLSCPYWFFLERIIGFREPPHRPSVDAIEPMAFGSLVHAIAAQFFTLHGAAFCANERQIEDWVRTMGQLAEREFELFLDRYPLRGRHAIERERRRVVTVTEQLLRHEWALGCREFVGAELPFGDPEAVRLDLPQGPLYVAGDIDRVDRFEDRGLEVRDLKTGRARDLAEEPLGIENDLQIGLYATVLPLAGDPSAAGAGPANARVGAAAYIYPVTEKDPERRFAGEPLAHLLAWTGRWLEIARMLLANGEFVRTPRASDCRFCPFTAHCGEGAHAASHRELAAATTPELRAFLALKIEERE